MAKKMIFPNIPEIRAEMGRLNIRPGKVAEKAKVPAFLISHILSVDAEKAFATLQEMISKESTN